MSCKLQLRKMSFGRDDKTAYVYSRIHTLEALLTGNVQMQLNVGHHFIDFVETFLNPSLVAGARDYPGKESLAVHFFQVIADLAETSVSNPTFQYTALLLCQ